MNFKSFGLVLTLFSALAALAPIHASALGFGKEPFQKEFYFAHTKTGNGSGSNSANAHTITTDATFWAIPANTLISKVYMIIDTAITGTSVLTVGDTDSATGFIPSAAITLGTPGLYGWDALNGGSYLRSTSSLYVTPQAKYYSAAGKYLTLTNTTTNTAGAMRLVVEGFNVGL